MPGSRYLTLLLLTPCLGAGFAKLFPATPAVPAAGPVVASLAFDQYLVNLRNEPLRPVFNGDYRFTNVGDAPLTITRLEPSCGCLQPQIAGNKRTYQPGEPGMFRVQVATANEEPGPHEYTVKVHYSDPEPQEATVRFKVNLPVRKITVDPPELAFFQYNGHPAKRDIHVTDFRDTTLEVTRVTSSLDLLTATIKPAETDEAGHHRIPIELHVPGTVPPGRQMATLKIETTDPEFTVIRIPILIDGPREAPGKIQLIGNEVPVTGPPPPTK